MSDVAHAADVSNNQRKSVRATDVSVQRMSVKADDVPTQRKSVRAANVPIQRKSVRVTNVPIQRMSVRAGTPEDAGNVGVPSISRLQSSMKDITVSIAHTTKQLCNQSDVLQKRKRKIVRIVTNNKVRYQHHS